MTCKYATSAFSSLLLPIACLLLAVALSYGQQAKQTFTVADEIGLRLFGTPDGGTPELHFSPDGRYFAVWTERGRLDLDRPEDSLWFYRSEDVEHFLNQPSRPNPPAPTWVLNRSTDKSGPIIKSWRWLADSSGVVFLERTIAGNQRLVLADVHQKTIKPLTSDTETVQEFDFNDRLHFVYTLVDRAAREKMQADHEASVLVGTGHSLSELLFPEGSEAVYLLSRRSSLWAVVGGKLSQIKHDHAPLSVTGNVALSPDGRSLVARLSLADVPMAWETLYPSPPYGSYGIRIHAGHHDLQKGDDYLSVHEYVLVDLQTGSVKPLTDGPTSVDAGWWATGTGSPSWSSDGREILLPGTFVSSKEQGPSRPCVAVVHIASNTSTCVETLRAHTETGIEEGYHYIDSARFAGGDKHEVLITYVTHDGEVFQTARYCQNADGVWNVAGQIKGKPDTSRKRIEVTVRQGLNDPPVLVAANKQSSRVIWDPNPQLKNFDLGAASVYRWKDKDGREWKGGLYKPVNYQVGRHYPLVIQTHGFNEVEFRPSGVFPTAFAARALAAAGIMVLQIANGPEPCPTATPNEGPCSVGMAESAANDLVAKGLVDPHNIGVIGFSRTCLQVMEMLTIGSLHLKAASITDGVMGTYFQYLMQVGTGDDLVPELLDSMVGVKPFGEGLQAWLKRSPGFNLDKVKTPLLVVGAGRDSLLFMWEAYAGLHLLDKPVDLLMLNTDEHILTNPSVRMASQGGTVDWFRFWLKGEVDPDPGKAPQYTRWREFRKLQAENEVKSTMPDAVSN